MDLLSPILATGIGSDLPAASATLDSPFWTPASKCIDGDTTMSGQSGMCHSGPSESVGHWLRLDMGSIVAIGSIEIYNRVDCCQDRLGDYEIWLGCAAGDLQVRCAAGSWFSGVGASPEPHLRVLWSHLCVFAVLRPAPRLQSDAH